MRRPKKLKRILSPGRFWANSKLDFAGGIATDVATCRDSNNPDTRQDVEKYLGGKAGIPAEHSIRLVRLVKDLGNPYFRVGSIHGEGSLAMQRMAVYSGAQWGKYKAAAKRAAKIPGWREDPTYGRLPDYPSCVASNLPPKDESYVF
jgi:aromatic ring hydroxylase